MKPWVVVVTCIASAANVLLFILWLCVVRIHAVTPTGQAVTSMDVISVEITILAIVLTAVAIGLAGAGVFGYQGLKAEVLRRADELVNERLNSASGGKPPAPTAPKVTPPTTGVTPEEETL